MTLSPIINQTTSPFAVLGQVELGIPVGAITVNGEQISPGDSRYAGAAKLLLDDYNRLRGSVKNPQIISRDP